LTAFASARPINIGTPLPSISHFPFIVKGEWSKKSRGKVPAFVTGVIDFGFAGFGGFGGAV
jgi:hypothetical protein